MSKLAPDSQRVLAACGHEPRKMNEIQARLLDMDMIRVAKIVGVLVNSGHIINTAVHPKQGGLYCVAPTRQPPKPRVRHLQGTATFSLGQVWR